MAQWLALLQVSPRQLLHNFFLNAVCWAFWALMRSVYHAARGSVSNAVHVRCYALDARYDCYRSPDSFTIVLAWLTLITIIIAFITLGTFSITLLTLIVITFRTFVVTLLPCFIARLFRSWRSLPLLLRSLRSVRSPLRS